MAGMISSVAAPSFLTCIVGCCLFLLQCSHVSASLNWTGAPMGSRNCVKRVASTRNAIGDGCVQPICGALNTTGEPFEERLTPSCKAVLEKYTAKDLSSSLATFLEPDQGCKSLVKSEHPTNPVVVQTKLTGSFAFCSVPKAACSQIRSLLFVMTRHPEPVNWVGELWRVHLQSYATLYHFDTPNPIPTSFPTFILGRSPYTRLLSGFLDKMTEQDRGNDMHTLKATNWAIGRGEWDFYDKTKEDFRAFLSEIIKVVKAGKPINEHFAPMVTVCKVREVPYHYFLRLEDMTQWMPCLRDSLKLDKFTDLGWDHSRALRSDWYTPNHRGCWWNPKGMTCEDYGYQSTEFVQGKRVSIDVPETNIKSGSDADVHSTSADDKWQLFYDQEIADMVYDAYKIDFEAFGYDKLVF